MLMSCKCLNFIATTSSGVSSGPYSTNPSLQRSASISAAVPPADAATLAATASAAAAAAAAAAVGVGVASPKPALFEESCSNHAGNSYSNGFGSSASHNNNYNHNNSLSTALMHSFLQKYPRNFLFYSQCMDFFKQSIGPIPDLTINAINQRELIYSLTLEVANAQGMQSWQVSVCINCNLALCAKRLLGPMGPMGASGGTVPAQFLINTTLWTTNDELAHRRAHKSFSETFGLLIIDHPIKNGAHPTTPPASAANFMIGSMSTTNSMLDLRQQRIRQLHCFLQQRLQREITETDERIQRYTEQQFALLKSFREKSEQEYDLLMRLIQTMPEQQVGEWLDRTPPALEVSDSVSYAARRRNTIGSRRDLNSTPAAPTTPTSAQPATLFNATATATTTPRTSAINNNNNSSSNSSNGSTHLTKQHSPQGQAGGPAAATTTVVLSMNATSSRKMSNFDTPPATPEATPMSVGNSPTFRQQQQQQQSFGRLANSQSFQQQFPTPTVESADDCLFDLEGIEDEDGISNSTVGSMFSYNPPPPLSVPIAAAAAAAANVQQQQQYQRNFSSRHENHMSGLDESDADAEEAEDALGLDLDSAMPIPTHEKAVRGRPTPAQLMNYAQSLPIEIANSPMTAERTYFPGVEEDELDNNVDIAASIKALAKSVHGEAVFGDLPRPRLRSQI